MLNISDPNKSKDKQQALPFLDFAFRPFFLFAAIFSMLSLIIWNGVLTGSININLYGGSLWWHIHEMLFAFSATVIVGFLLTAVQNWSGIRSLNGKALAALVLVWLAARIAFFLPEQLPNSLIIALDMAFLPLAVIALAKPIIQAKLWRNLLFIPILLVMATTNGLLHYSAATFNPILMGQASTFMVLLITLVMCIMGGRVFPMFTANGTKTPRVDAIPTLEKLSITSILIAVIVGSGFIELPAPIVASLFIAASIIHAFRVYRWKFLVTLRTPLVWSLHVSYWCIAIGLLMFGLSEITHVVSHSQAIHTLTIGAMATMILGMISRVSLGHTGRNIVVGKTMKIAFVAIIFAFIVRVFGLYFIANYSHVLSLAVALWVIAFGCFVVLYLPLLIKPKAC
ncbi:NnrS family protein [Psychromonas sp. Urea-02u-13]|uniref:NnrS family protein n=1 Tax=Psychromonas sp. Urea-02u-13 TaxID=2058326 RepID=UPI000C3432A7|nr:NnrS family protein [Psychromonas sp. Urea-02u-13]PKG38863.1 NnrS family protein [Psychromonas sp. Urea-02u-13]